MNSEKTNAQHTHHVQREPLIRIAKRTNPGVLRSVLVRAAAVALAFLTVLIFLNLVSDFSFGEIIGHMYRGAFNNSITFNTFLKEACMLLLFAVALAPAFKMSFWNIGAQGQVLMGGLAAAIVLYYLGNKLPNAVIIPLMIVAAVAVGLIWALIPAFFKVKYETNETLFTLMMNYVAIQVVAAFTDKWKGQKSALGIIDRKNGYVPALFGNTYGWVYVAALAATILMYVYLTRTKHGYEISVVGESINTARYAGIDDRWVILRTIAISGAICGVAGFLYVSCLSHTISTTIGGSYGFTAITVAWLAKFNPVFMTLIAILLSFLDAGAGELVNKNTNLNASVSDIVVSIFLFFILGCEFFIRYRLVFREKPKQDAKAEKEG